MKAFLIAAFLFCVTAIEAQGIIKLSINRIIIKVVHLQSTTVSNVQLSPKKFRPVKSFSIWISPDNTSAVYKSRLEITDSFDSTLIFSSPEPLKKETFVFDAKKMATILSTHK